MSPSPSKSVHWVIELETSESPSPSKSSPLLSVDVAARRTGKNEAKKLNAGPVRKVISLIMSNLRLPAFATSGPKLNWMYDVGIAFHEFAADWIAALALA